MASTYHNLNINQTLCIYIVTNDILVFRYYIL